MFKCMLHIHVYPEGITRIKMKDQQADADKAFKKLKAANAAVKAKARSSQPEKLRRDKPHELASCRPGSWRLSPRTRSVALITVTITPRKNQILCTAHPGTQSLLQVPNGSQPLGKRSAFACVRLRAEPQHTDCSPTQIVKCVVIG